MKDYEKLLKKLPKQLRLRIIKAIERIATNDTKKLDIKILSGQYNVYRCRVGKIRILFQRRGKSNFILDIGFRGGIYSKMERI